MAFELPDGKTARTLQEQVKFLTEKLRDLYAVVNQIGISIVVVETLPEEGEPYKVYLVPAEDPETGNYYEEYIWYDHSIKRNQTIDNLRIKLSYAEPKALEVFSYDFIEGGLENFVTVNDVIISEDVAKKYDLKVGDVLTVGRGLATKMTRNVVGIYKNLPKPNSISECEGWSCDVGYNDENSWGKSFYVTRAFASLTPPTTTSTPSRARP